MPILEAFGGAPVLVTGGYGFIGSNLVRRLVRLGARVTVVDALVPNTGANRFNLADVEELPCTWSTRPTSTRCGAGAGPDAIFNLAGRSATSTACAIRTRT
jgi:UDP-glucose 4-epimerase